MFSGVWSRSLALMLLALSGLVMAGTASAAASPGPTPSASAHVAKPVPVRPPSSPGAGIGTAIPAKPHPAGAVHPLAAWSVTLTASSTYLWPTTYSTLTAAANQDVDPTLYYLRIYDETARAYVITCAHGTTCTIPVTQPTPTHHSYTAFVALNSASYPPDGAQARSSEVGVDWRGVGLTLSADRTTTRLGTVSQLAATTSADIGPSPFWIEIYDATTGTRLASEPDGTQAFALVVQHLATTHKFVAYLSSNSTTYPPPGIQETSPITFVTWSNLGWTVSLSAAPGTFGSEPVTATTNADVGPTPYDIEIFDEAGNRLAACGSGSSCSVNFTPSYDGSNLVAFVSPYSATFPPDGVIASSNTVTTTLRIIP